MCKYEANQADKQKAYANMQMQAGLGKSPRPSLHSNLVDKLYTRRAQLQNELNEVDEVLKTISEDAAVQKVLKVLAFA